MFERFKMDIESLAGAVLLGDGETSIDLRQRIQEYVTYQTVGIGHMQTVLPENLVEIVSLITFSPDSIEDEHFEKLAAAGYSDDAILEILFSAALGAGMARYISLLNASKLIENETFHSERV